LEIPFAIALLLRAQGKRPRSRLRRTRRNPPYRPYRREARASGAFPGLRSAVSSRARSGWGWRHRTLRSWAGSCPASAGQDSWVP